MQFPLDPSFFNVAKITSEQATPTGNPYLLKDDFQAWQDANQPISYVVYGGQVIIDIPDYRTDIITDFLTNWFVGYVMGG